MLIAAYTVKSYQSRVKPSLYEAETEFGPTYKKRPGILRKAGLAFSILWDFTYRRSVGQSIGPVFKGRAVRRGGCLKSRKDNCSTYGKSLM